MTRKTVKIKMPRDSAERDFHIDETKVEKFVARVIADGGTARVVPFEMSADLVAMLTKAGVNASKIK